MMVRSASNPNRLTPPRRAPLWLAVGGLALGAVAVLGVAGCAKPLFPPDEPRTQYDRYNRIRDRQAPAHVTDEFGRRYPNLRGRLIPPD